MSMQYDVTAKTLAATGSVFGARTRVKGVVVTYESGGSVKLRDGGATGSVLFEFSAPSSSDGVADIGIPGEGILFETSVYAELTDASVIVFCG